MEKDILKRFDEKYVASRVGKIYNWKATALTDCTGVKNFIINAIRRSIMETKEQYYGRNKLKITK